jgi:hypothetical protein
MLTSKGGMAFAVFFVPVNRGVAGVAGVEQLHPPLFIAELSIALRFNS